MAVVAAACSGGGSHPRSNPGSGAPATTAAGGTFRLGIVEPTAIDPFDSQDSDGQLVTKNVFEGLVTLDPRDASLKPGVATSWDHDVDCRTWTFHLAPGTRFSNGEVVTARSFIDGMTRAARQKAASDTAEFMSDIDGYEAVHGSGAKGGPPASATTFSGLSAPDPDTLVVALSKPNCEFDKKTLQPVFSPVPSVAGEADLKSGFASQPIGNGPFMLKGPWQHDRSITLVRNPMFHGAPPALAEVDLTILPSEGSQAAEYKNFQAGQADWARIPTELLSQAKATYQPKGEFIGQAQYGVSFLLPEVTRPPLDSSNARLAVSLAIDRDAIINGVFKGFKTKATSLVPPPLATVYQPGVCDTCVGPRDPMRARHLAEQAGVGPGTKLGLEFITGQGNDAWVQAVAQQIRDALGWDVTLTPKPMKEALADSLAPNASGLFQAAWFADYPSADDFLRPLLSKGSLPPGDNRGRYVNDQFDSLLDQAVASRDPAEKVRLTRQAEQIAIGRDMAEIPLWYSTQYRVYSNQFSGLSLDFFNNPTLATIVRH
ncbi:MAG: peptide ABC transporter substrate-binding protein [Acidimicrobiales bacterium]